VALKDCFGTGTIENPYVIENVATLDKIRADLSAHYELETDIDANKSRTWNVGDGFTPIGDEEAPFTGSTDGRGHKITGLYIGRSNEDLVGLFGVNAGSIERIDLYDIEITGNTTVGGIASEHIRIVRGCSIDGTVTSSPA